MCNTMHLQYLTMHLVECDGIWIPSELARCKHTVGVRTLRLTISLFGGCKCQDPSRMVHVHGLMCNQVNRFSRLNEFHPNLSESKDVSPEVTISHHQYEQQHHQHHQEQQKKVKKQLKMAVEEQSQPQTPQKAT